MTDDKSNASSVPGCWTDGKLIVIRISGNVTDDSVKSSVVRIPGNVTDDETIVLSASDSAAVDKASDIRICWRCD